MKLSEFELINSIKSHLISTNHNVIKGIGDDCAVVNKDDQTFFVISSDALIEDVHFDLKYFSLIDLGKKAMAVNLSDIAAMGAKPLYALVTLSIPSKFSQTDVSDLYTGMEHVAQEFSVAIIGGDLSASPEHLYLSLTVVGEIEKDKCKYRSNAKAGDGIYVSGKLGSAAVGLSALKKKRRVELTYNQAIKNPRPRLYLSNILAECPFVNAVIDTSDGLVQDLGHVMRASKKVAHLDFNKIPCESDFVETCKKIRINPEQTLLTGGEDYQLIFCMDDNQLEELLKKLEMKRNIHITRIGTVLEPDPSEISQKLISVYDEKGKEIEVKNAGFDHFA